MDTGGVMDGYTRHNFDAARNLEMESLFLEEPEIITEVIPFLDDAQRENKIDTILFLEIKKLLIISVL